MKIWEKLMKEVDDGDGGLDYNEFVDLVRRGEAMVRRLLTKKVIFFQSFRGSISK